MKTISNVLTGALTALALSASLSVQAAPGQGYDAVGSYASNTGVGEMIPGMPGMGVAMAGQGWDAFRSHALNIGVGQSVTGISHGYIGTSMESAPTRGFNLFRTGDSASL
ncbi:MAG TPA: hypothetical protein PLL19_06405 [Thiobacillaceae bacterium]|nr:hypothetical protein [Thiobacillaceae bacterium]HNA82930.1 hypothetical protein [Thiobacillaceae bacterium]HNF88943.1 hypothetical protein [Thiobacillaceae bacterium]HNH88976.1 hypothetical protein [Thiobacillaceae bacterium]